jgi:ribonuclease HII
MSKQSISDIKNILDMTPLEYIYTTLEDYRSDERSGVQKLLEQYEKKVKRYENEIQRLEEMKQYENKYNAYDHIGGIDEVGRGPLAGPVVASVVILPKDANILYLNDSKKLSEKRREELYLEIMEKAISVSVGMASVATIDDINILQSTYQAMEQAVRELKTQPDVLLIDAVTLPNINIPQENIIKGDAKSISIAAASIIAKVTRDRMMADYDVIYPEYGFARNKGYGTEEHIEALKKYGPSPIHRLSFIKNILE